MRKILEKWKAAGAEQQKKPFEKRLTEIGLLFGGSALLLWWMVSRLQP